jgi:histidinol-phosphate aminotransferase
MDGAQMNPDKIPFTSTVAALPATIPFVGPETLERELGHPFRARIGANESAFGISPHAAAAMREAVTSVAWYGDPENYDLREALARHHGVAMDEICVDAGIDSLLGLCVRMLVQPGGSVVTSLGAYPTFNYHVAGFGAELVTSPYVEDREDPEGLLDAARSSGATLVYIANPDNPMGTTNSATALLELIDAMPEGRVLILDEAYAEFAPEGTSPPIDTTDPRVIRMRTFSKAYGMAGARVGYAIAHRELVSGLNKIRNHFAVNRLSQIGALASLEDHAFLAEVRQRVEDGRNRIYELARDLHLASVPSSTNFVAVDLGGVEIAQTMLRTLHEHDIFVRMPVVAPLNRCIRVGVGTDAEMDYFDDVFASLVGERQIRTL